MATFSHILSVYSADTAGVCSMLYELGGMVVVHDASGCNSTYATHDEPRWQTQPSRIFISALTEQDAIMGNDARFVDDVCSCALEMTPRPHFIAICGAPIPMMIGTDFDALGYEIEQRTGIPVLALHTSGMGSYLKGASDALLALCKGFCLTEPRTDDGVLRVNILGATPLDFPRADTMSHLKSWLARHNMALNAGMAMGGCTLVDITHAAQAAVNLVVSSDGLATAKWLREQFAQPYVIGVPYGEKFADLLAEALREANAIGKCLTPCAQHGEKSTLCAGVVGECVNASSLATALQLDCGQSSRVLMPFEPVEECLVEEDAVIGDEDAVIREFAQYTAVYADPMYRPLCPAEKPFFSMPSIAFSGRCYREHCPQLLDTPLHFESQNDYTTHA